MNSATKTITTHSAEETERLGEAIGRRLRGDETIELVSDLGGGKTTFVRGLARGLGSSHQVSSPTFTISQVYAAGERALAHFDFYRLTEPGLMADELAESIHDPQTVVVIEWGDIVADVLPAERLTIAITATGESARKLTLTYPDDLSYIVQELA
jgi:tRNA threonylcarbamoyladenosine biosynthesis protein TsaE